MNSTYSLNCSSLLYQPHRSSSLLDLAPLRGTQKPQSGCVTLNSSFIPSCPDSCLSSSVAVLSTRQRCSAPSRTTDSSAGSDGPERKDAFTAWRETWGGGHESELFLLPFLRSSNVIKKVFICYLYRLCSTIIIILWYGH